MSEMAKTLRKKEIEDGLAIALSYLQKEFPNSNISIIDPDDPNGVPDRDPRLGLSRSFWIDYKGPQRIIFTIKVLETLSKTSKPVNMLRQWGVADFIRNSDRVPIKVTLQGPEHL